MIVARICASCNAFIRGSEPCTECAVTRLENRWSSVQIGMIDGEQVGYFPPEAGPYVNPGKSIKRVLKNNNAWREMIKRSEGKIGDIS